MDQPVTKPVTNGTFRAAVLTVYGVDDLDLHDCMSYVAYSRETCPSTGTKHLQCFAYAKNSMRMTQWKKCFPNNPHVEKMMGTFCDSVIYCTKESSLIKKGTPPMENGKRRDLQNVCQLIMEREPMKKIARTYPVTFVQYHNGLTKLASLMSVPYRHSDIRGVWIYGPPGVGKSHTAKERFPNAYVKSQNKWWDGYNGEENVILDDYDCGVFLGHYMKIWMDKWECTGEIKGGTINLQHHKFIVTSNYSIEQMFPDDALSTAVRRRCEIQYISKLNV